MNNPGIAPLQFFPNGESSASAQSSYFAQGLQALFSAGGHNTALFEPVLDNALRQYTPLTRTWNNAACFGVYTQAFAMRALGFGLGRDLASFLPISQAPTVPQTPAAPHASDVIPPPTQPTPEPSVVTVPSPIPSPSGTPLPSIAPVATPRPVITPPANSPTAPINEMSQFAYSCSTTSGPCTVRSDTTFGMCRLIIAYTPQGTIRTFACQKNGEYIEVYRQQYPTGTSFTSCIGTGCVDQMAGFARFRLDEESILPPHYLPSPTPDIEEEIGNTPTPSPTTASPTPTSTPQQPSNVRMLDVYSSPAGTVDFDKMDGYTCRRIQYTTSLGTTLVKICEKEQPGVFEMYRQSGSTEVSVCVDSYCVGPSSGFARFTLQ